MLVRVCPLTPTRCKPVAFGFKTRESVSNLGPPGQFSSFISYRTQSWRVRRSSPRTSAQPARSASVLVRVCPLTPTRCNPVAFVLRPENPCQTWDPRANFRLLYRIELKVGGSAVRAPDLGQTSGKCQCAGQVCPLTPTRCNPVAFGFKTRESVSNLGPPGQFSSFISYRTQSWRVRRSSPGPRPN